MKRLAALLGAAFVIAGGENPAPLSPEPGGGELGPSFAMLRAGPVVKLTASDGAADDRFGLSVSIDGELAIVGARRDDDAGTSSGSAYIFQRNGASWTEEAKLTASDAAEADVFGFSVSIDGELGWCPKRSWRWWLRGLSD